MSSESKPKLSNNYPRKNLQIPIIKASITILILCLLGLSGKISSRWLFVLCLAIAVLQFFFISFHVLRKYNNNVYSCILITLFVVCIKIFDAIWLDTVNRFWVDTLVYLFWSIYLLTNKKIKLTTNEIILLLFIPSITIYLPYCYFADPAFRPLVLTIFISLLFFWFYTFIQRKFIMIVIAIFSTLVLSFLIYPNYLSYIEGKEIKASQLDKRLNLSVTKINGDTSTLSKVLNKIIILDVWYSGCGVCFKKFPEFDVFAKEYAQDTNLFIATLNIPLEKELDTFNSFDLIKEYSFNKLQATSTTNENKWDVESYPTVLVFDKNHKLRYKGSLNTNKMLLVNNIHKIIQKLKKE